MGIVWLKPGIFQSPKLLLQSIENQISTASMQTVRHIWDGLFRVIWDVSYVHPFISMNCEENPSSGVDTCSVPLWSHEMTLTNKVHYFFCLSGIFLLLLIIPSPPQYPLPGCFQEFLSPIGIKHCTKLKSLRIIVQEWAFLRCLLCFHEEVSSSQFYNPEFIT